MIPKVSEDVINAFYASFQHVAKCNQKHVDVYENFWNEINETNPTLLAYIIENAGDIEDSDDPKEMFLYGAWIVLKLLISQDEVNEMEREYV